MEDLLCNMRKCRKRLNSFAWVTSCSHIFCDEDGSKEFNKNLSCPACETNLSGKFDIVRIDLSPTEQYKSMVLAGHKPETIIEVCSRAVSFWVYQTHQERLYQDYTSNKVKEKYTQLEQYYEQILGKTHSELTSLKNQMTAMKKELESTKKRYHEVSEKLVERSRQHQKLQLMYDALRRKSMTVGNLDLDQQQPRGDSKQGSDSRPGSSFDLNTSVTSLSGRQRGNGDAIIGISNTPPQREFILRPNNNNMLNTMGEHASSVQSRFNMELGTPNDITRRLGHRRL